MRATTVDRTQSLGTTSLICAVAWAVPGAGHLWLGRRGKGMTFIIVLPLMFLFGLWLEGRLFPFSLTMTEPLVPIMATAELGIGVLYVAAKVLGAGSGDVVAMTYEYGNTFLIVGGLLNMLVVLDAFDIAQGRK
jgi:hypothetical protein